MDYQAGFDPTSAGLGIRDTTGTINGGPPPAVIPDAVAPRVAAVALFGNPIRAMPPRRSSPGRSERDSRPPASGHGIGR